MNRLSAAHHFKFQVGLRRYRWQMVVVLCQTKSAEGRLKLVVGSDFDGLDAGRAGVIGEHLAAQVVDDLLGHVGLHQQFDAHSAAVKGSTPSTTSCRPLPWQSMHV